MDWDNPEEVAKERARLVHNVEVAEKRVETIQKVQKISFLLTLIFLTFAVLCMLISWLTHA
jgi:hypothetical protein